MGDRFLLEGKYIVRGPRDVDYKEWSNGLRRFIYNKLRPIIPDNHKRGNYTTHKAMKVWEAAFTHPGFDKIQGKNYEELEFIGDRALKYAFNKYTMDRFPEYDKSMLSDVETTYMSKTNQPKFGKEMELDKYARILIKDSRNKQILEDLFESFMGALDTVSDQLEDGLGIVNVRNFVAWFFNKKRLGMTPEEVGGVAKTKVRQIFERFDVKAVREGKEDLMEGWYVGDDGIGTYTAKITPGIKAILRDKFNIVFRESYLGRAKDRDKQEAEAKAYKEAWIKLNKYGINERSADLLKELYDFARPELLPYRFPLLRRLSEEGYVRAFFTKPSKLRTDQYITIILMVEDERGKTHEIESVTIPKSTVPGESLETESKMTMIRNYIGEKDVEPSVVKGKERVEKETEEVEEEIEVEEVSRDQRFKELKSLRVPDLKDILRDRGLKVGGKKDELIERILDDEFKK